MTFQPRSDLLRVLTERGYVHQATDLEALDAKAAAGPVAGYIGFDATASSLHVGSLVQIMMLRRLQQTGHKPVVLMGGGTTRVGDPSGKDATRSLLDDATIERNIAGVRHAFGPLLTFGDGETDAIGVNNADWLDGFGYVEFLREFGRHFTVNRMLSFDSVKLRLEREQPLSFLEFNYMLMQAVDFLELGRRHAVSVQLGGSDQWGNIVSGVELCRRIDQREVFGVTTPLITTASGAKMGKTAAGAVWLNADELAPYDYWQFWRNTEDQDVGRFMRLFTDLRLDEIARYEALAGSEINEAKKVLADAATSLLHGVDAAQAARGAAESTFEEGRISADLPTVEIDRNRLAAGVTLAELVADVASLASSRSEARRLAAGGGLRLNDEAITDAQRRVTLTDFDTDDRLKLAIGRKKIVLVRVV